MLESRFSWQLEELKIAVHEYVRGKTCRSSVHGLLHANSQWSSAICSTAILVYVVNSVQIFASSTFVYIYVFFLRNCSYVHTSYAHFDDRPSRC